MKERFVLVLMTFCFAIPAYADVQHNDAKSNNINSFELTPNNSVLYQPWPADNKMSDLDGELPPPPPGPYISTAFSTQDKGFSQPLNNQKTVANKSTSPLLRPETPWPVKQFQPQMWMPKNGTSYVPPHLTKMSPAVLPPMTQSVRRMAPKMYKYPNHANNMNYLGYQGGQHSMRSNHPPTNRRPMYRYPVQQPSNAWKTFDMPVSNYPRPNHPTKMSGPYDLRHSYNRTMPHNRLNRVAPIPRYSVPITPMSR